ncbi:MAG TPA: Ppx/GppA phosphatase family protein [Polyangia bacterium]|jgi:exopolyphosphatase/guanosine-5'-triphosphate,3'-diphosphate pyrophosphatase
MRIAALDVGSNSFHLIVAEVEAGGRIQIRDRAKEMVRLGDATLRTGLIPPDVFQRGLGALKALRRIADRHQPDALIAVATSAVREAQNGGEFVRAVRDEIGIDIRVIRGDEEARLIYLGARSSLDLGKRRVALFDLGGGSIEVILADAQECYFTASLKLGVIRVSEEMPMADPPTPRQRMMLADRIRAALEAPIARLRAMGFDFVAFTSGTASALAGLLGTRNGEKGSERAVATLSRQALTDLEQKLSAMTVAQRASLPGLDSRRADTILAGAMILRTVQDLCDAEQAVLCDTALREGIVAEYVVSNRPGILLAEEFPDLRRRSVMELCRRCHFHAPHAQQVARLAQSIFRQTHPLHDLSSTDGEILEYAALLHDIGFYISASRHHRHTQYLIESNEMAGFSEEEQEILALTARYHRKAVPGRSTKRARLVARQEAKRASSRLRGSFAALPKSTQRRVRWLTAILRIADALDRTHATLVRGVRCTVKRKTLEMRLEVDADPELELWAARRKGDLLELLSDRSLRFAVDAARDNEAPARARPTTAATTAEETTARPDRKRKRLRLV